MSTINIEKRSRANSNSPWGPWTISNDIPPYSNTATVQFRTESSATIDHTEITNNVETVPADGGQLKVQGNGIFDDLMETVDKHIQAQFSNGRITQETFAQVYLGLMQSVLTESIKFSLQKNQAQKQFEVLGAQQKLYERQTAGFDDNKSQKILEAQLNAWGITFQDTDTTFIPEQLKQSEFDLTMDAVRKDYTAQ